MGVFFATTLEFLCQELSLFIAGYGDVRGLGLGCFVLGVGVCVGRGFIQRVK